VTDSVQFILDDKDVLAQPGETIWEVAKRTGTLIPHLCHRDAPGYRPDGNCRVCMVEIKGERVLAPSCLRRPLPGMQVLTGSERSLTDNSSTALSPRRLSPRAASFAG
jgi:formate dehydrogenase major subunit